MTEPHLLVIDDDVELAELLTEYLGAEGFRVSSVHDGLEGLAKAESGGFAMVVLDVMLPGTNGFEVLRKLRARSNVPVLMLTARGEDVDRIVGLELGADDYLAKPFNPRELVARVRAILRRFERSQDASSQGVVTVGPIEVDLSRRVARANGEVLVLTGAELSLLDLLLRNVGRVVSRDEIAEKVLGRPLSGLDRSVDVHMSNLRKKLGAIGETHIKSIRGVGYQFAPV